MNYEDFFKGKKITMIGLGLLGRGVGDAEFLARCGADVLVTDKKQESELRESVAKLSAIPQITFRLGEHRLEDFQTCDMVVKGAGVPLDSPYIEEARASGVPIYMTTALFAKFARERGAMLIGVTGTRGKSTITYMIRHALVTSKRRVIFGGNIRGVSTLSLIQDVREGDIAVLELDSWQLQGFGDLHISPHIAIFSNLMQDHLNYYLDMQTYFNDKANIFRFQTPGDFLFCGAPIADRIRDAEPAVEPLVPEPVPPHWNLVLPGSHNRENAALAIAALRASGLSESEIRAGVETFPGVEGRLQFVGEKNDIRIYNDNNSTTPQATVAALRALGSDARNIVLIVGGNDKNIDMTELLEEIPKYCSAVVLFKEKGTDRIRESIVRMDNLRTFEEQNLRDCVDRAISVAKSGDIVLYSPAFTSFGANFKNEFDRNDQFMALVSAHLNSNSGDRKSTVATTP